MLCCVTIFRVESCSLSLCCVEVTLRKLEEFIACRMLPVSWDDIFNVLNEQNLEEIPPILAHFSKLFMSFISKLVKNFSPMFPMVVFVVVVFVKSEICFCHEL